jgi:hypothetical protein
VLRPPRLLARAALAALLVAACSARPAETPTPAGRAPEHTLAIIERGRYVAEADPLVAEFARELSQLASRCTESRVELARAIAATWRVLNDRGIVVSPMVILVDVENSILATRPRGQCDGHFAAYERRKSTAR